MPGEAQVDVAVLAMGSGAALGLGFVMGFVFKADERWSTDDDRAMEAALARELDPDLARDSVSLWVHARSSVFVMLGIATLLPAALLTIAVPWLAALLVALALLAAACLFARIRVDRSGMRVFAAGIRPGHGRAGRCHRGGDAEGGQGGRLRRLGLPEPRQPRRPCWSAADPPSSSTAPTGGPWPSAAAVPRRRTTSRRCSPGWRHGPARTGGAADV